MPKEVKERAIQSLILSNGKSPFDEWLLSLKEVALISAVDARLTRVRDGNFGDHKSVGEGVFELRIDKRAGLRIYYALIDEMTVLLLTGGDKGSQKNDIRKAKKLWDDYKDEN